MTDKNVGWCDMAFRRSSFSGTSGGNCVEIAVMDTRFGVRDSKNAVGPVLAVPGQHGQKFVAAALSGRFTRA
jgi:Domain of unknown function (DUF397)